MNGKKVMLTIQGEKKEYPAGTSFLRIAQDYSDAYQDDIVLVLYNRRLRELNKCADGDGTVEFLTTADKTGKKAYRRSVTLLMQKAVYNLWGKGNISVRVKYSIGQGNYCELVKWENDTEEVVKVSGTEINKLKNEMYQMVVSDIEIHKESINTDDAVTLFHDLGMTDKEKLFRYRRSSRVNIYELDHYMDYFYGFMVPSTGYLRYYDVIPYADGFMLQFPDKNTREVAPFVPAEKLFHTLKTSRDWGKMLEIDTIGALNDAIAAGKQGAISIHRFVQPHSSLTIGRNRNDFIELNKNDIKVENYDNSSRQLPGHNDSIDTKHSFRDAKLVFTEEQVKAETARCLGCGASVVDQNKCIGCGICTTKCEFDAIKLHRELPGCSKMVPSEDKLKYILPNGAKQAIKIKFSKKK